ncbi:MAG: hypothetical protein COT85_01055 [Chlamydiae bacterium CG10_big_fil_rev_8_21_14_0_10_42_34]|nr:MAG: hypothetical protein COT85_01055 [Chlamydiae bacterium CG10_big_fil_rev_8_21_14_0_10_42_34]
MVKAGIYHYYPERIMWVGCFLLAVGCILALPFAFMIYKFDPPVHLAGGINEKLICAEPLTFSFKRDEKGPVLPAPNLQGEVAFLLDPPRPIGNADQGRILVRIKKSAQVKQVALPCRVDLEFQGDRLGFAKEKSSFWLELAMRDDQRIECKGFINSLEGGEVSAGTFLVSADEPLVRSLRDFSQGSAFKALAEARWLGRDQFSVKESTGERLELLMAGIFELNADEWLVWKDQKWEKCDSPDPLLPIARIHSVTPVSLVFEGWDADGYVRFMVNSAVTQSTKLRPEEIFSSIRIRSEKQISCMLEKQCIVLKAGDWVLKSGGKWKILRKKEERDAFTNGKLSGELFVFEQITLKKGQKMIQGKLFNSGRTQMVPVELAAQSGRKIQKKGKVR